MPHHECQGDGLLLFELCSIPFAEDFSLLVVGRRHAKNCSGHNCAVHKRGHTSGERANASSSGRYGNRSVA